MSYEEISAELDQKFTELGQNFGWVRPQTGHELGVKFWIKNPALRIWSKYACLLSGKLSFYGIKPKLNQNLWVSIQGFLFRIWPLTQGQFVV